MIPRSFVNPESAGQGDKRVDLGSPEKNGQSEITGYRKIPGGSRIISLFNLHKKSER
jgi:hypothetical protein